jgi:acyl-CoA dehydrogenase
VVSQICTDVIAPLAGDVDRRARCPLEALTALRAERLLAAAAPLELGGLGCHLDELLSIARQLAGACASTGMIWAMHQIQVACMARHGTPEVGNWVRTMCDRQHLVASVTSEVGTGGDIRSSRAPMKSLKSGGCTLQKDATTVSYVEQADAFLLTARRSETAASGDQVLVLALRDRCQVETTGGWDTLGMRGTCGPAVKIRAVFPPEHVLRDPFAEIAASTMVPHAHLLWSACWLGIAEAALRRARRCLRASRGQQRPLAEARLAEAGSLLQLADANLTECRSEYEARIRSRSSERGPATIDFALRINNLKLATSDIATAIVTRALHVCGMAGYSESSPYSVARHLRDVHSASLMIGNDRLYAANGAWQLTLDRH